MPPLLLEYLPDTISVVVQQLPQSERWPIWLSAGATLAGSFGGALIGGLVAYKSTLKATRDIDLIKKKETIYTLAIQCKHQIASYERKRNNNSSRLATGSGSARYDLGNAQEEILARLQTIKSLVEIGFDKYIDTTGDLLDKYDLYLRTYGNIPSRPKGQLKREDEQALTERIKKAREENQLARIALVDALDRISSFFKYQLK